MATTPSFNWPTPDNTGLVKNGALDIRTLGNSIDSSMTDLKGGTTGQILAKATDTDMDFAWITNDVGDITAVTAGTGISGGGTSGAVTITNSMATEITAKGDLIVGTGSATFDNLAAGSNGDTLVADSSTSTGLRYTAGNPIPNPVINSAFQIWQRGTSVAVTSSAYTADRWMGYRASAGATISRQVTNDTTNLPSIQYCARVQRDSGNASTDYIAIVNSFETINSIPYAGKTVTLSFYARAGANYSSTSNLMQVILTTGTGTDQNALLSYTGGSNIVSEAATLTTTWQRFTYTAAVGATATELGMYFYFSPTGTASANDFFEITGVQIDVGSVALPFRTNGATIQGELAACQRYYYRQTAASTFSRFYLGNAGSTTVAQFVAPLPATMRTSPTALDTGGSFRLYDLSNAPVAVTSFTIIGGTETSPPNIAGFTANTASGLTAIRSYTLTADNSATAYLGFSAEL
jgi:hypothetical protein